MNLVPGEPQRGNQDRRGWGYIRHLLIEGFAVNGITGVVIGRQTVMIGGMGLQLGTIGQRIVGEDSGGVGSQRAEGCEAGGGFVSVLQHLVLGLSGVPGQLPMQLVAAGRLVVGDALELEGTGVRRGIGG